MTEVKLVKDPNCKKCDGKGYYYYDENHGQICEGCCKHDKGWWLLKEHYGKENGKMCCMTGCGTTITWKAFQKLSDKHPMYFLTGIEDAPKFIAYYHKRDAVSDMKHYANHYKIKLELSYNTLAQAKKTKRG